MSSPEAVPRTGRRRRAVRLAVALLVVAGCLVTSAASVTSIGHRTSAAAATAPTPVQQWLAAPLVSIAHRGGSADWPEASPLAYRNAVAWSPSLALEFPARRTSDGVWVGSEDATTGRVFGRNLTVATSTWAQLSTLRSLDGSQPMSRLQQDLLAVVPRTRILLVDDKADAYVGELLSLLGQYGGSRRTIVKSPFSYVNTPAEAHRRGYLTWGYYYPDQMDQFAATQGKFDLLAQKYSAPASTFATMRATGKRVFAHIVTTAAEAKSGTSKGATGLMVAGVEEVVPKGA